jgi:UDP-N-acetylmuramoyl-tripeptide--D-alanyl-D-alanine ligase
MSERLCFLFIAFSSSLFIYGRLIRYLHYFQQEEYLTRRFLSWIYKSRVFDTRGSIVLLFGALSTYLLHKPLIISFLVFLGFLLLHANEEDPRIEGKKLLIMTERAKRILSLSFMIYCLFASGATLLFTWKQELFSSYLATLLLIQMTPLWLIFAKLLLQPGEKRRQKKLILEAKEIFAKVSPYVIGVTGSYGKTSMKCALGEILRITLGPTFYPPKSINTEMGITREIREKLEAGYRFAVFEMGAYGVGSIARLCRLTPPHAAIITSIGVAHLERFKTKEEILKAKSELAKAVPKEGILVCNGDDPGAREIAKRYPKKTTLLYGFDPSLDCYISSWNVTSDGMRFTLHWRGKTYEGSTPLFGKTGLSNIIGAFTMACALGSDPEYALAAISVLEPVDNRLQVKKEKEVTYLKDAYNSNPLGFRAALEVAGAFSAPRKILMTPGMIELGPLQEKENEEAGYLAAQVCARALIVGSTNQKALMQGLQRGGMKIDDIIFCPTRDEAFKRLSEMQMSGDLILIENDLVDLYEGRVRF